MLKNTARGINVNVRATTKEQMIVRSEEMFHTAMSTQNQIESGPLGGGGSRHGRA